MQKKNKTLLLLSLTIIAFVLIYVFTKPKSVTAPIIDQSEITNLPQVQGNKEDLVSFSIRPGQEVSGKMNVTGTITGGYFFEGNLPISILDVNKNSTQYGPGHANSTTDWMTAGPVSFAADFDFSLIPKGSYYIKLMQDDPSGGESGKPIKSVIIPIIVK